MSIGSILVVDDEEDVRELLQGLLESADYQVTTAVNGRDASVKLATARYSLVLTDLLMPDKDGMEVLAELRKKYPGVPSIVMSGGGRLPGVEYLKMAKIFGATAILDKPFSNEKLLKTVESVLAKAKK